MKGILSPINKMIKKISCHLIILVFFLSEVKIWHKAKREKILLDQLLHVHVFMLIIQAVTQSKIVCLEK